METFIDWVIPENIFRNGLRIPFFTTPGRGSGASPEVRAARIIQKQADDAKVAQLVAAHQQSLAPNAPPSNAAPPPTTAPAPENPSPETPITADQLEPDDIVIKQSVFDAIHQGIQAIFARFPEAEAIFRAFDPDLGLNPAAS